MVQITFVDADGNRSAVEVAVGTTLMQAALNNGVEGILGECGGQCACATCHCYLDEGLLAQIAGPDANEQDMLSVVQEPRSNSRLGCQVKVNEQFSGQEIHLPREQF